MECELGDLRLGSDGLVEGGCGLEGGEGVSGATVSVGNPSQEAGGGGAGSPLLPFSRNSERGVIGNVRIGKKSFRIYQDPFYFLISKK